MWAHKQKLGDLGQLNYLRCPREIISMMGLINVMQPSIGILYPLGVNYHFCPTLSKCVVNVWQFKSYYIFQPLYLKSFYSLPPLIVSVVLYIREHIFVGDHIINQRCQPLWILHDHEFSFPRKWVVPKKSDPLTFDKLESDYWKSQWLAFLIMIKIKNPCKYY